MLTPRAQQYLATLQRVPAVSARQLQKILQDQGDACFDTWMDFQERYAGYIQPIGRDTAIWGIVHDKPSWLDPRRAVVEREPHAEAQYVTCADVHPSYVYKLDDKGEFFTPPARSFDVKVERDALVRDFFARGPARHLRAELRAPEFVASARAALGSRVDAAASDDHLRYYADDNRLIIEDVESAKFLDGWSRQ